MFLSVSVGQCGKIMSAIVYYSMSDGHVPVTLALLAVIVVGLGLGPILLEARPL